MDTNVTETKHTQQRIAEQNLAGTLYRLGQGLTKETEHNVIVAAYNEWQTTLEQFIEIERMQNLQQQFKLDTLSLKLIAISYINNLEPETLAPYLRNSWYEQGPTLSLERALYLSDIQSTDKPTHLDQLLSTSPAYRYRLLQLTDTSTALIQPLLLAEDIYYNLANGTQPVDRWIPANLLSTHTTSLEPNPVIAACYAKHLQTEPRRINTLQGLRFEEREALVAALAVDKVTQWYQIQSLADTELSSDIILQAVRSIYLSTNDQPCHLYWPTLYDYCQKNDDGFRLYQTLYSLPRLTLYADIDIEDEDNEEQPHNTRNRERLQQSLANTTTTYQLEWPTQEEIANGWQALSDQLSQAHPTQVEPLTEEHTKRLATLYRLYPTQISALAAQVQHSLNTNPIKITLHSYLQQAARQQQASVDQKLATHSQTDYRLEDMVLAEPTKQQIQELIDRILYGDELKKMIPNYKKGAQALFWGKPGTGKTMAAHAIAGELQLPLYQVNLANIASKWIGESEKHLAKLFDAAEQQQAILLFDEADAIFAKRSAVESSHDKNANMGVSFLLQRMESYTGLLLLSTNFKSNLDDAFLRRFHAAIEFKMPDALLRKKLWQKAWATDIIHKPNAENIALLAETFEFSPSQIRNIAERSLLFALTGKVNTISEQQLKPALTRELEKEGAGFLAEQKIEHYFTQANTNSI